MKKILCIMLLISILLSSFSFTASAAEEIIITTSDSLCTLNGSTWQESTSTVVAGPTGGSSWYTGDKKATAVFDASGLAKGNYGVYLYVTPWGTTPDKIDVTITASGKSTTLITDGMHGGLGNKHWIFLGKYDFDGSKGDGLVQQINADAIVANGSGNSGYIRTSGVKFVKDDTNTAEIDALGNVASEDDNFSIGATDSSDSEIVITTSDSRCKLNGSSWKESTNKMVAGPNDGSSWYTNDKKASVVYDASGVEKATYGVYVYMTPWGTSADKVNFTITASGKSKTFITDGLHGGKGNRHWIFLGKYEFDGSKGDGIVQQMNADAVIANGEVGSCNMRTSGVKFVKNDTNTAPIDALGEIDTPEGVIETEEIKYTTIPERMPVLMGTEHAGFSKDTGWTKSSLVMPVEGDGFYTTKVGITATWHPYINKAENVEVFYLKPNATEKEDPGLQIEVFAGGETKTTIIDFTQPPTDWFSLGRYNFSGDGSEYIRITKINPAGTARLTCLKFSINENADNKTYKDSAFYGTDLHIVERMGMLIGEGDGITEEYIKKVPTRVQAAIMVLRLNGVDAEAAAFTETDNFADAAQESWAMPYLAYLKAHPEFGLIGTGDNMFEPTAQIDEQAYAKILLTALGYEYNIDFTWDETLAFAKDKGIAKAESSTFTVKDLAIMTASALNLSCKDGTSYLTKLVLERDGVVDEGVYGTELPEELKAAREAAKNKKRGLIYNNDGNDAYVPYDNYPGAFDISNLDGTTINAENFLKTRSYGLEDTQVGTVMYCTGVFNSYTHESVGITDTRVRDWARALKEYTGKDSLTTMVDYVHSTGRDIFWSMRMNDTHDHTYEENELDPWKQENLDLLMYRKSEAIFMPHGDRRWSSVDYTLTPVRQIVYDILKDTLTRYDVDGLELDFTRWPIYFKQVVEGEIIYPENLERMNNLIRMIRDLTEKVSIERGKPILIAIYVPNSMGLCHAVGLDIKTWLEEALVDIVTVGGINGIFQPWDDAIGEYDNYDVPVYAGFDANNYAGLPVDPVVIDRNEAAIAYAAGADGIYMYNCFNINDVRFDILGSPETCGPVDEGYVSELFPYNYDGLYNLIKDQEKYITFKQ